MQRGKVERAETGGRTFATDTIEVDVPMAQTASLNINVVSVAGWDMERWCAENLVREKMVATETRAKARDIKILETILPKEIECRR